MDNRSIYVLEHIDIALGHGARQIIIECKHRFTLGLNVVPGADPYYNNESRILDTLLANHHKLNPCNCAYEEHVRRKE